MGIAGLSKALKSLHESLDFSYPSDPIDEWVFLIDGPSLVYWIFQQLCQHNFRRGALSTLDAQQTCSEISAAVEAWLSRLDKRGRCIVLWDGELPASKRPTRLGRMQSVVGGLVGLRRLEPQALRVSRRPKETPSAFDGLIPQAMVTGNGDVKTHQAPTVFSLPAPPFMIPACRESLAQNFPHQEWYGQVPGEADDWLAARARWQHTASSSIYKQGIDRRIKVLVLSEDSDLAAHDLGDAYLASFSSLSRLDCDRDRARLGDCQAFSVQVFHQKTLFHTSTSNTDGGPGHDLHQRWLLALFQFSRRLGKSKQLQSLRTLYTAACKGDFDAEMKSSHSLIRAFCSFQQEHAAHVEWATDGEPGKAREEIHGQRSYGCSVLDVRLNELAAQMTSGEGGTDGAAYMYLPPLLDDPDRTTAWVASRHVRTLVYRILATKTRTRCRTVREYARSGVTVNYHEISLASQEDHRVELERLGVALDLARRSVLNITSEPAKEDVRPWMALALAELQIWHLETGKAPPAWGAIVKAVRYFENPKRTVEKMDWQRIHLLAMVHAYLYSFRMLEQALEAPSGEGAADACAASFPSLRRLPPLTELICTPRNMPDIGLSEGAFQKLVAGIQALAIETNDKVGSTDGDAASVNTAGDSGHNNDDDDDADNDQDDDDSDASMVDTRAAVGSRFALLMRSRRNDMQG